MKTFYFRIDYTLHMRASKKQKSIQSTLLGLSPLLWLELFFKPHLSIESGIYLSSTCSFFWNNERIQEWLREKEIKLFGSNIPKLFWNKLEIMPDLLLFDTWNTLDTRFSFQRDYCEAPKMNRMSWFGVFSSKERLWNAFNKFVNLRTNLNNEKRSFSFRDHFFAIMIARENPNSRELLRVSNIILEDFKLTLLPPILQ